MQWQVPCNNNCKNDKIPPRGATTLTVLIKLILAKIKSPAARFCRWCGGWMMLYWPEIILSWCITWSSLLSHSHYQNTWPQLRECPCVTKPRVETPLASLVSAGWKRGGGSFKSQNWIFFLKKIEIYLITKYFINSMIVFWTEKQKLL